LPTIEAQLVERPASLAEAGRWTETDAIRAEQRRAQLRRLETMGRLAGGIAHDFNNLLTIILSANEALADQLDEPRGQALAKLSLQAAERGSDLVRRLLAFSRHQPLDAKPIDCGELLRELAPLFKCTIRDGVSMTVEAPRAPLCCWADRTELEAAILNLCVNAKDALPDGGIIDLAVASVDLGADQAAHLDATAGRYAAFSIHDNGVGMSEAVLERACEPLFTTKGPAGTGFGLATVKDFAGQSNGALEIRSRQGAGTTVILYLPLAEDRP
jgi:signal transduction histidine kinase